MKSRLPLIILFVSFFVTKYVVQAQGVGKLQIYADFSEIIAKETGIEISIINMSTNKELVRKEVEEDFTFAFPLEQRYLLYFHKDGYCTTRLLLDTRTFMSGLYTLKFGLSMSEQSDEDDVSSIPIGVIKFNGATASFGYQPSQLVASIPLKVSSSIRQSEVVKF